LAIIAGIVHAGQFQFLAAPTTAQGTN
jgi:hypothetical protein